MTFFQKSPPAHERPHGTAGDKHSFQRESVWITELSFYYICYWSRLLVWAWVHSFPAKSSLPSNYLKCHSYKKEQVNTYGFNLWLMNNPFDGSFKPTEQWNSAAIQHPLGGKDSILASIEITCNQPVVVSHWLPRASAITLIRGLRDQNGRAKEPDELSTVVMVLH